MKDHHNPITDGPIFPALTKFAIPILFSLVLQALYGAVDLWMVSQFGTNADVSAVSTGSQTIAIVTGIITGLSMGTTILLGQSVGERDDKRGADIIGTSVWIFGGISLILTTILLLAAPSLATLLNAPGDAFGKTVQYIRICGAGTIFVVGYNLLSGIFCGLGDSKTPLLFVGVACIANLIGDYVLIDIFHMGTVGAAIATIGAQAISVVFSLLIMKKELPFPVHRENFGFQRDLAFSMVKLGLPIALLRMCNEISYLLILGFVNTLGVIASSGVGIAEKLVMFVILIPTTYMSAISAFVAQNRGANQPKRAKRAMWVGMASASVVGGILAYTAFFHGDLMSRLFINDPAVISASAEFLKATSIECFILSIAYCFSGYFNGIEKTGFVMLQGVCASLLVRTPFAYFASIRPEPTLFGIGFSAPAAALFMLGVSALYYLFKGRKETQFL